MVCLRLGFDEKHLRGLRPAWLHPHRLHIHPLWTGVIHRGCGATHPWSSEYHDTELALVYYNYRHYTPTNGRWTGRDLLEENDEHNLYTVVRNATIYRVDRHGLFGFNYMRFETALYEANARLTTNGIRAISELLEGYSAMRDANIIGINCAKESSCECC